MGFSWALTFKLRPFLFAGFLFGFQEPHVHANTGKTRLPETVELSLTRDGKESRSFSCVDRITATATFPGSQIGSHRIDAEWIRPNGEIQEKPGVDVSFVKGGSREVSLWIEFRNQSDVKRFGSFGSRTKIEQMLNGRWHVKLYQDGTQLLSRAFEVRCP